MEAKDTDVLKDLSKQLEKLSTAVEDLKKKVDGDKGSDKDSDLSDLAALLPLFSLLPLGFGASLLFPLGLRLGAARALALGRALEHAAKVTSHLGKEHGSGAGMSEAMQQLFKLKLPSEEQRKLLEAIAIIWKAKAAG